MASEAEALRVSAAATVQAEPTAEDEEEDKQDEK